MNYLFSAVLLLSAITVYGDDLSHIAESYQKNKMFYDMYLGNDTELNDLGTLHLLALRYLIDMKLEDQNKLYIDSNEIFDHMDGDKYLTDEFYKKYH